MHEVPVQVAGDLIPVSVQVSSDNAIPAEVSPPAGGGGGLSNAAKDALLQIARKVVYVDAGGQTYYNALYEALYPLVSISAVYTQSGTVYDTDTLDSLKTDLVVTATYGDSGTATVPAADYTLSGTLTEGTSTITVTYQGKTATFTVTVTHAAATLSYIEATYVQGAMVIYDTDPLSKLNQGLTVEAYYSDGTVAELTVGSYTLSGTLTPGTSTITVTYQDKTDTFTATVTANTVTAISAVYTQSGTVYTTDSLDSLKTDLVVTATYADSSTATVAAADYTLSGTLTAGTSTVTVSYGGQTTTFSVTVTQASGPTLLYNWDLTTSATDTVQGVVASGNITPDSSGLHFTATGQYFDFGAVYDLDRIFEIDVATHDQKNGHGFNHYGRVFAVDTDTFTVAGAAGFVYTGGVRTSQTNGKKGWGLYLGTKWDTCGFNSMTDAAAGNDYNDAFFNGKTIRVTVNAAGFWQVAYKTTGADDSTYVTIATTNEPVSAFVDGHVITGSSTIGADTDYLYYTTITGLRVFSNPGPTLLHDWDMTDSWADTVGSADFAVPTQGATYNTPSITSAGTVFGTDATKYALVADGVLDTNRTIVIDVASCARAESYTAYNQRLVTTRVTGAAADGDDTGLMIRRTVNKWDFYNRTAGAWQAIGGSFVSDYTYFSGKQIEIYIDDGGMWHFFVDGVFLFQSTALNTTGRLALGSGEVTNTSQSTSANVGMTISRVRVYDGFFSGDGD